MRKDVIFQIDENGRIFWRSENDRERIADSLNISALDDDNIYYFWRA